MNYPFLHAGEDIHRLNTTSFFSQKSGVLSIQTDHLLCLTIKLELRAMYGLSRKVGQQTLMHVMMVATLIIWQTLMVAWFSLLLFGVSVTLSYSVLCYHLNNEILMKHQVEMELI